MKLPIRELKLTALQYRRWLVAGLATLFAWSLLNGAHKGAPVLVVTRTIAAGSAIGEADVRTAWIDGVDTGAYAVSAADVTGRRVVGTVSAESPLMLRDLRLSSEGEDRVIITLPLEAGDSADYVTGAAVHVWSLGEEGARLLSNDAVVVGTGSSSLTAPRVALSLPRTDEFAAVSATAVRLVVLSYRDAADG